jgi:hypothetical protein
VSRFQTLVTVSAMPPAERASKLRVMSATVWGHQYLAEIAEVADLKAEQCHGLPWSNLTIRNPAGYEFAFSPTILSRARGLRLWASREALAGWHVGKTDE